MPSDPLMASHLRLASACLTVSQQIAAVTHDDLRALLLRAGLDPDPVRAELAAEYERAFEVHHGALDLDRDKRDAEKAARELVTDLLPWRTRVRDLARLHPPGVEATAAARRVLHAMGRHTTRFRALVAELRRLMPAVLEARAWLPLLEPELSQGHDLLERADTIEAAQHLSAIRRAASPRTSEAERLGDRLRTVCRQWRFARRLSGGRLPRLVLSDLDAVDEDEDDKD